MIIDIAPAGSETQVQLLEPDVFSDFHIQAPHHFTGDDVAQALSRQNIAQYVAGQGFYVSVEWIRDTVQTDLDSETWGSRFNEMLIYAVRKNWYLESANAIQAHVVFSDSQE